MKEIIINYVHEETIQVSWRRCKPVGSVKPGNVLSRLILGDKIDKIVYQKTSTFYFSNNSVKN